MTASDQDIVRDMRRLVFETRRDTARHARSVAEKTIGISAKEGMPEAQLVGARLVVDALGLFVSQCERDLAAVNLEAAEGGETRCR